jgi:hypothetical protein
MTRTAAVTVLCVSLLALPGVDAQVSGTVFADLNANGRRDPGEAGLSRVAVSNQVDVVATDSTGAFRLSGAGNGIVFVSVPEGYRAVSRYWQRADSAPLNFALAQSPRVEETVFIHASDVHIQKSSLPRMDRLRSIIDSVRPAFVVVTGDLTRDALRVGEAEARGYFELYRQESARITVPVWNVPGNHENFGIERHLSLVDKKHPLYGRAMYRHYLGPDYYSFTAGGVHFVGLNSVDYEDLWYYGHVDSTQLRWLQRDLAHVPRDVPIVTFNHIPFAAGAPSIHGYDDTPGMTVLRVGGKDQLRHVVSNLDDVLKVLEDRPFPLALGGHFHERERVEFGLQGRQRTRFEQAAAVVGPGGLPWLPMASGVTVYRVHGGRISEGEFVALDSVPVRKD